MNVCIIRSMDSAIERAINECTVEYDTVDVRYDEVYDIWRVAFYSTDMAGGGQTVYMGGNGITELIVYGE